MRQRVEIFAQRCQRKTIDDDIHLLGEIGIQRGKIVQRRFCQQQCRGHFERQGLVVLRRVAAQLVGLFADGGGQLCVRRVRACRFLGQPGGVLMKG